MEKQIRDLFQCLQSLVGLHRKLLEVVRVERESLASADLKSIQTITETKQGILQGIHTAELNRLKQTSELALMWKKTPAQFTFNDLILEVQSSDIKQADQLRTTAQTLKLLIDRISEQNQDNQQLVENFLEHIQKMKMNVLSQQGSKSETYTAHGTKSYARPKSSSISKEV